MSERILFFGNERLATGVHTDLPILKMLVLNGYHVTAIILSHSTSLPSRKARPLEIKQYAQAANIPVIEVTKLKENIDELRSFNATAGILAAFGKILPKEVIELFPIGIINVHPSLLPRHRGSAPIESVILSGEDVTGVTLIRLIAEMDAGPVFDQMSVELDAEESKQDIADTLGQIGAERLRILLPDILSGKLSPIKQASKGISYDTRIDKADGNIDINKPAIVLAREVRAYLSWPRSRFMHNDRQIIITKAHAASYDAPTGKLVSQGDELALGTIDKALIIDRLIPAGKQEMSGKEYISGYGVGAGG